MTQAKQILAVLQSADGRWVSALELHELSGSLCVHSRVADLRKLGHMIVNQTLRRDGRAVSQYRLLARSCSPSPAPIRPRSETENEFTFATAASRHVWPD